jgi:tRNA-specific 2-thiouridylase
LDAAGKVLGEHSGLDGFTIGQRKGLPALGTPHYVAAIAPDSGDVTLVPREGLKKKIMFVDGVHWLVDAPEGSVALTCDVKVRARHEPVRATVIPDGEKARVDFSEPVDAITPGQAAVFYRGTQVLGGGWIDGSA